MCRVRSGHWGTTRTANAGARVVGNLSVENSAVAKRSRATTVELTKKLRCVQVIMGSGIFGILLV